MLFGFDFHNLFIIFLGVACMSLLGEKSSETYVKTKLRLRELSLFCYHMGLILKSGIPMVEGIQLLSEEITDIRIKKALEVMYEDIKNGVDYHVALSKHKIFPQYMISICKIGEITGTLDNVMDHLSKYYEKEDKLKRKLMSAVTYPAILLALMSCVILLLILKILPMFNDILNSVGGEMPQVTKVLLGASLFIKRYMIILAALIIVAAVGLYYLIRTTKGRIALDKFKLEFPPIKAVFQKLAAARFSMGMSLMLKSGIDSGEALEMAQTIVENSYVAQKIKECKDLVDNGLDTASAFSKIGVFPSLFIRMINIGYKTGELDNTMSRVSEIYDNEVDNALQKAATAIEPLLVIILSVVIGVILLTVMLPLINIMSSIG
jgi:type IV pilus assembly protein PilC